MCHGCGAISSLFLLVILRVATVDIHGCRASIASAPTTAAGLGTGSDGRAGCASRRRACVGRSSDKDCTTGPSAPAGWTTWYSSWTGCGFSCTREAGQVGRQREGMAQQEFRDESSCGSQRSGHVGGHDDCGMQYGCYGQRYDDGRDKGKECAVVFRLDHVVHKKSSGSHCKCTTRLGHGGVANALSNVLSKEQCETCL